MKEDKKTMRQEMRERDLKNAEEKREENRKNEEVQEKRTKFQLFWNRTEKAKKDNYNKENRNKIYTGRKRPDFEHFKSMNSNEIIVETTGVIPISEQVRRFERAGVSLEESMDQLYNFGAVDVDNDGFADRPVQQYSDKISGVVMLMEEARNELKKIKIEDEEKDDQAALNLVKHESPTKIELVENVLQPEENREKDNEKEQEKRQEKRQELNN